MEKLYTSKAFLKMASEKMHTPHLTTVDPPPAIIYKNLTYFSPLAPLILFFFTKRQSQKGGSMAQCPP